MQLVDSAPAAGGYATCFQVHALARRGILRSEKQIIQLVDASLQSSIGPSDGVAVGWAFKAARQGDLAELPQLAAQMSGSDVAADIRAASLEMGAHLWELSRRWDWAQAMHGQVDAIPAPFGQYHAMAFGTLVSETTAQEIRAIALCLFSAAKAIIRAAVMAIPLDESVVLKLLSGLQPEIADLAHQYAACRPETIHAAPSAEVVQTVVRTW
jgi:urease accessory protein UreF